MVFCYVDLIFSFISSSSYMFLLFLFHLILVHSCILSPLPLPSRLVISHSPFAFPSLLSIFFFSSSFFFSFASSTAFLLLPHAVFFLTFFSLFLFFVLFFPFFSVFHLLLFLLVFMPPPHSPPYVSSSLSLSLASLLPFYLSNFS